MNYRTHRIIIRVLLTVFLFGGLKNYLTADSMENNNTNNSNLVVYYSEKFKSDIEAEGLDFITSIKQLATGNDRFITLADEQIIISPNVLDHSYTVYMDEKLVSMFSSIDIATYPDDVFLVLKLYVYTLIVAGRLTDDSEVEHKFVEDCAFLFGEKGLNDAKMLYNAVVDDYADDPEKWNQWGLMISKLLEFQKQRGVINFGYTSTYIDNHKDSLLYIENMEKQIQDYYKDR